MIVKIHSFCPMYTSIKIQWGRLHDRAEHICDKMFLAMLWRQPDLSKYISDRGKLHGLKQTDTAFTVTRQPVLAVTMWYVDQP